MTSFSTTTLGDVIDFVVAVCHCAPNLAYELWTPTRRFPAKFKSQSDFFKFRNSFINVLIKMPKFRENRECIACAYRKGFINDRQFVLLYDANTSKNPDLPYWKYDRFDLDELGNDQCKTEFRFYKNDIFKLAEYLQLPDEIVTYNGLVVGSIPALCIYLKRFTHPCRYGDMVSHFARPVPELCIITK